MQIVSRPEPPAAVRRMLFQLPLLLYQAHLGGVLGGRFVLIRHTGRVTGLPRQTVVEVVRLDPGTGAVTVASGLGPRADWYRNLHAHPEATIQLVTLTQRVRAAPLADAEAGDAMVTYARRHLRAARAVAHFMGLRVDGTEADYRAAAQQIPMIRFEPATPYVLLLREDGGARSHGSGHGRGGGTVTTGHAAAAAQCRLTEPRAKEPGRW